MCSGGTSGNAGTGTTAFDDGVGEVSGEWVLGRPPSSQPGLLVYIMVDSVAASIELVIANGGEIVQADWRGCSRDYCEISRSGGKRDWGSTKNRARGRLSDARTAQPFMLRIGRRLGTNNNKYTSSARRLRCR